MVKAKPSKSSSNKTSVSSTSSSGISSNNYQKIAVVDVMSIVSSSEQVKNLKQNHAARSQQLSQWLKMAQTEVDSQTEPQNKNALLQKYNAEYAQKQQLVMQMYNQELSQVNQSITQIINEEAHKKGYDLILAKNVVLCGGDDITEEIRKLIK